MEQKIEEAKVEKEVYSIQDLQEILGRVCYWTACKKMREVKEYRDRLKIKGYIHRRDWEDFLGRFSNEKKEGT